MEFAKLTNGINVMSRCIGFSNTQIADTLARTLYLLGNSKLAFQAPQRAVRLALADKDSDQHLIAELRVQLREYAAGVGEEVLDDLQP